MPLGAPSARSTPYCRHTPTSTIGLPVPRCAARASRARSTPPGHARSLRGAAQGQRPPARGGRARANREHSSRHEKALPLYGVREAEATLKQFAALPRDGLHIGWAPPTSATRPGPSAGASGIHVSQGGRSLLFPATSAAWRPADAVPPQVPPAADVVLVESTYGNRLHPAEDAQAAWGRFCATRSSVAARCCCPASLSAARRPAAAAATPAQRRRAAAGRADLAGQPDGRAGHRADGHTPGCCASPPAKRAA